MRQYLLYGVDVVLLCAFVLFIQTASQFKCVFLCVFMFILPLTSIECIIFSSADYILCRSHCSVYIIFIEVVMAIIQFAENQFLVFLILSYSIPSPNGHSVSPF